MNVERIASMVVDSAIRVHQAVGPGMLESAYEAMLEYELLKRGLSVERQKYISLAYEDLHLEKAFCIDLLVAESIIIEVKSVQGLMPVHQKQLITYLKMTGLPTGFLLNFGQMTLKAGGIRRLTNNATTKSVLPALIPFFPLFL